ncbi:TonB-dependent receptor plug domain-containing protein [uncultured Parabacteroides sp.]|uniref:TonB-dependent receptor plug domain-containing protein n=1 Tax=uncultured Parabacteroides sp. TaxID=512312 RepID=UPI002632D86E|nr:TonB-dependent receptor plug domain-containing protein [uncultured Parabacteroides sp.]
MRMIHILTILSLIACSQLLSAQNDTLVGVLRDISNKKIKRYPVTLGSLKPITVKTNRQGVFTIPGANLNDTLFVTIKKTKNTVKVPVNGYNYITITLENSTFNAERSFEPSETLREIMERERNKMISSSVMHKEEIQKTGCRDLYCLLRRMSGITFADGSVRIRASASLNSPSDPLVVVDGIPMDLSVLNTMPVEDVSELRVLKDAGEYGVRGANGAIVIKTGK